MTEPTPILPTIDKRGANLAPDVPLADYSADLHRLAEIGKTAVSERVQAAGGRPVLTVHNLYGPPPGELRYVAVTDWTDEMVAEGNAWVANQRGAAFWRAQVTR